MTNQPAPSWDTFHRLEMQIQELRTVVFFLLTPDVQERFAKDWFGARSNLQV